MPTIQIGNFFEQYQPDGDDVKQGPDGSGEATLTYKRSSDSFTLASLPNPLSEHPKYSALRLYEAQAKREPGLRWQVFRIRSLLIRHTHS